MGKKKNNTYPALNFPEHVKGILASARKKHSPINSVHEGYAVLLEEVDELWDEVKKRTSARCPNAMYSELVDIAAMCQRMAEDVVEPLMDKSVIDPARFAGGSKK